MSLLFALLLIVMGVLVAQDFLIQKWPALKKFTDAVNPYAEPIGLIGIVLGILWFFKSLGMVRFVGDHPIIVIDVWLVSILTTLLGLILGLGLIHKFLDPAPSFLLTLDKWRLQLLRYNVQLGLAGIAVGVLTLL